MGPFRLGGGLRREHWGPCSEPSRPSSTHLQREEGRQLLLCPAASDRHLLKPHMAESPAWCQHRRTSSSSLVLGGTQTKWIPTFVAFLVLLCFGSQLASHLAFLVLATGCGNCAGQSGLSP